MGARVNEGEEEGATADVCQNATDQRVIGLTGRKGSRREEPALFVVVVVVVVLGGTGRSEEDAMRRNCKLDVIVPRLLLCQAAATAVSCYERPQKSLVGYELVSGLWFCR